MALPLDPPRLAVPTQGIPEDPGPCTEEFQPVIVAASGTWNGEPRHYRQEFSNRCVAVRATGGVIFAI